MSSKKADIKINNKSTREVSKERLHRITKSRKHRVRTTGRVLKYGSKSFVRNTWLSIAAIAIMAITLIIIGATVIATSAMKTAIAEIESKVDISVYIKQSATKEKIGEIVSKMTDLESVTAVNTITPEEANRKTIEDLIASSNITDEAMIKELKEAPNALPWTLNIKLVDLSDTSELENFVENDASMQNMLDAQPPSYANKNRDAIDQIAHVMNRIQLAGLIAAGVFAVIAILIVFNTIRMAIFSRKEEIYMMKLVGASRWFITGPFVVEAGLYGVASAAIAIATTYGVTYGLKSRLETVITPTFDLMTQYWFLVAAAFLLGGIILGVISSLLATRKYLKM
ncbi:permease-like cell division protein FtsX [Candidatus Saccharibacteria bacterium]|nr:permease-like cell division protein FtsX [Candidatus Saccharibacteria bacterium]